ncbi:MAG: hypothetical protein WBM13_06960 [Bacteroidia bacterium]
MSDLDLNLVDLKSNVEKLVRLHQTLKNENKELKKKNTELLEIVENQTNRIQFLERSNSELTTKNSTEQEQRISETKIKINELVQEIDNCIALLK